MFGIAMAALSVYEGEKARKQAKKEGRRADAALDLQQQQYEDQKERFDSIYRPLEQSMADELNQDPRERQEAAANEARSDFTTGFDASQDESQRNAMRYGINPGSQQFLNAQEDQNYDRALGSTVAANQARTIEDDKLFARKAAFLSGGSNLSSRVAEGFGNIAATRQGLSDSYASDAGAAFGNLGRFANMGMSAITKRGGGSALADRTSAATASSEGPSYKQVRQGINTTSQLTQNPHTR